MRQTGVLPMQMLRQLLSKPYIVGVGEDYLNPASIDLPLSSEAYRLVNAFLPRKGDKVKDYLSQAGAYPHSLDKLLEVGVSYLVRVQGKWKLPKEVYAYANPKSSTGRIFVSARVLSDGVGLFDTLGAGYQGDVWVMIRPRRFPIIVHPGIALAQLRFFDGQAFLDRTEATMILDRSGLIFDEFGRKLKDPARHADSLLLSLGVSKNMGWECRGTNQPLDLSGRDHDPRNFFEPISPRGDAFDLRAGTAYILATRERVMVPPKLSAELRKIDPRFGSFDVHDAGYIDPGWGYGSNGSKRGRPITLEITPYEDMRVFHGQQVSRIRYERMKEAPEQHYDDAKTSNYRVQKGPALAKFFKK